MGLRISVYRDGLGDCTNGGLSGQYKDICVVNADGPFEPDDQTPAFKLEENYGGSIKLVPVDQPEGVCGPMFGGNYGATSDSRFGEKIEEITGSRFYGAVAIHDRFETWEQYDQLSR